MSLANDYVDKLSNTLHSLSEDFKKVSKMVSKIDAEVNMLYHEIETGKYNASAGYKKLKQLQDTLRKRRVIKNEFVKLDQIQQIMKTDELLKTVSKTEKTVQKTIDKNSTYTDGWNIHFNELLKNE